MIKRIVLLGSMITALAGSMGCTPPVTDEEKNYFDEQKREKEQRDLLSQALQGETKQGEALKLVKDSEAILGEGNTQEWLDRLLKHEKGDVMFTRWATTARGANKYEVRFTYTLMGEGYVIEHKGFSWVVDLILKKVSDPRALADAELGKRERGRITQQQRYRQEKEKFSLE
jgi:hypothetical protein